MKLIDNIISGLGLIRKSHIGTVPLDHAMGGSDPFILWRSTKKISPEQAMQVFSGWVYACIRAIAEELAKMEFQLWEIGSDGTNTRIHDHELLDLLDGVNPNMTGFEMKYQTGSHLEIVGNAYWLLDGVEKETDKPTAIYILKPQFVKPKRKPLPNFITEYAYTVDNDTQIFKNYQIIHFKYPDPNDLYEGIGTVQSIAPWIDADNYAMEFNRRFFLNGARLGGLISSQNALAPEQLEYLKRSFEALYKGVNNAYSVAALPAGSDFKELGQSQKDMDFANLMTMMRDRILAGFRVPRTALGITDDVNRANAEATDYVFAARTIMPKMQLIVSYLNEFLVPRYGQNLYLTFTNPVPENRDLEIREMAAAVANQPVMSVNEARERYFGAQPIDNGDSVMTDFQKIPLGKPQPKKEMQYQRAKAASTGRPSCKTKFARNMARRKEIADDIANKAAAAVKNFNTQLRRVKRKDFSNLTDKDWEVLWKAFVTRVTPYEKRLTDAIREINKKQEQEIKQNLERAIKAFTRTKAVNADELFDNEEFVQAILDLARPILLDLYEKEGTEAASLLGVSGIDILTPEVRTALERSIGLMADKYNETTRQLLKSKLEQGLQEGASMDELTTLVSDIREWSDEVRAERVARTETFRTANDATHDAWQKTGVVKTIRWFTAADERVCEFCEPMHGKTIGIEETFFDEGDAVSGTSGGTLPLDYGDVGNPPLHVDCRCYIRPDEISIEE